MALAEIGDVGEGGPLLTLEQTERGWTTQVWREDSVSTRDTSCWLLYVYLQGSLRDSSVDP